MMASLSKASTSRSSKLKPGLLSPAESGPEKSRSINEGDPALPQKNAPAGSGTAWRPRVFAKRALPRPRRPFKTASPHFVPFGLPFCRGRPILDAAMARAYLSKKLTRPLRTKDGGTLRTVLDARAYMLRLSRKRERSAQWQRAAQLALAKADVGAFSRQLELALLYDGKLDHSK